ncbi:Phosphoglycerol transferase and related proteins%2C alkaline phosphatase superfamily [uncultured Clostridium sp.]|nr:Phosphoglycerol transferase and related proteins%2C alkaline phosphatase superfamily [uncultured Clostridium sp.]
MGEKEDIMTAQACPEREGWGLALLLAIGFAFNIAVFAPLEIYVSNVSEFWFGMDTLLPAVGIGFVLTGMVTLLLCRFLPGRGRNIARSLFFSLLIALYIQGNFLSGGYPIMDGEAIPWDEMVGRGWANAALWLLILAGPLVLLVLKEKAFQLLVKAGTVLVLGIETVTLGILLVATPLPSGTSCYLSTEQMYRLSPDENIVVVVSDTFEAAYMQRALREFPELAQDLRGFTFYPNTSGVSAWTYLSMGTMLTGEVFPVGKGMLDGMQQSFESDTCRDYYATLHGAGYQVNYFTEGRFFRPEDVDKVDNLVNQSVVPDAEAARRVTALLYRFAGFKYLPHFAKTGFVVDTGDFDKAKAIVQYPLYTFDDTKFYHNLRSKGIDATAEQPQYMLYHLEGVHAPYNADRDLKPIQYPEDTPMEERRFEKSLGQIKILNGLIGELKRAGVYENTTLIFTADHGHQNRFNPVLMIKPAGAQEEFFISNAPISMAQDFVPFIQDLAQGEGRDAALYQIPEDAQRERYVYNYFSQVGYGARNDCRTTIALNGSAGDMAHYQILRDEYAQENGNKQPYVLNTPIRIHPDAENAVITGIDKDQAAYSKTAQVCLNLAEPPQGDLTGTLTVKKNYGGKQRLVIMANDVALYEGLAATGDAITFPISKEHIQNNALQLMMQFPDTAKKPDDNEGLDMFAYQSFAFDTLTLNTSE